MLYDLDGTLIDSFEDIARALNHGLEQCGLAPHSIERVKTFVGDGIVRLVERALEPRNRELLDEVLPLVRRYYAEHPAATARTYPRVVETVTSLRKRGLGQVIVTNKPHPIALQSCDRLGLTPLFDAVQGEAPGRPLKPDPEVARAFMREFGVQPSQCLMVGDGKADAELARAAGLRFVGCAWGMTPREKLAALGADPLIDGIEDLLGLLD